MIVSVILASANAIREAMAICALFLLRMNEIMEPVAIRIVIFMARFLPCHASWSLSRAVRSSPMNRSAFTTDIVGPSQVVRRLARVIAVRYRKT